MRSVRLITNTTIEIKEGGVRLDAAILNAIPSTTRTFVKDAIASGNVLIAGEEKKKLTVPALLEMFDRAGGSGVSDKSILG